MAALALPSPFPSDVAFATTVGDDDTDLALGPFIHSNWSTLGPIRQRDLLRGRRAAALALETLQPGWGAEIVRLGPDGNPVWPAGVTGSISHKRSIAVSAVGRSSRYAAIGVDVELRGPRGLRVLERIAGPAEQRWIAEADSEDRAMVVFSAKEAIFKALHPICKRFFGFLDAEVRALGSDTLEATIRVPLCSTIPAGFRFLIPYVFDAERVITGVALEPRAFAEGRPLS